MGVMQRALRMIYPDQCVLCAERVEGAGQLCPTCWRETPFLNGLCCDKCGCSLSGDIADGTAFCDDCLSLERPWVSGRAAVSYRGSARRAVLALKHGDRTDLVRPFSHWMQASARPILRPDMRVVPVPVFWSRLVSRRYNQAAELARTFAEISDLRVLPEALIRTRSTAIQDGMTVAERFANLDAAIEPHARFGAALQGGHILLIDDVMTSGATLASSTTAAYAAGAKSVCVLALARVEKRP